MSEQILKGGFSNKVTRRGEQVLKEFLQGEKENSPEERLNREYEGLLKFGGIVAPALIGIADSTIITEFLPGYTLQHLLHRHEATPHLEAVGEMVAQVHKTPLKTRRINSQRVFENKVERSLSATSQILEKNGIATSNLSRILQFDWSPVRELGTHIIHGDLNGPNIIISPDGPKLVDWENWGEGTPYTDLSRLLSFSLLRFQTSDKEFWEGYKEPVDDLALNGFMIMHLLHRLEKKMSDPKSRIDSFTRYVLSSLKTIAHSGPIQNK